MGNTPTSVGKTPPQVCGSKPLKKHPHERGEDDLITADLPPALETPPRAWGRHNYKTGGIRDYRNTPTSVGKTGSHAPV